MQLSPKSDQASFQTAKAVLIAISLFGFWELSMVTWPVSPSASWKIWSGLLNSPTFGPWITAIDDSIRNNERIVEMFPMILCELVLIACLAKNRFLEITSGAITLIVFATILVFLNNDHGSFVYYDFWVLSILLASKDNLWGARLLFATTYFLCTSLKLNAGWVTGGYFFTVPGLLPAFPDLLVPLATNALIIFQGFLAWGLLSENRKVRLPIAYAMIVFHTYAILITGSRLSWVTIPALYILFVISERGGFPKHVHETGTVGAEKSFTAILREIKGLLGDVADTIRYTSLAQRAAVILMVIIHVSAHVGLVNPAASFNMFTASVGCVVTVNPPGGGLNRYGFPPGSANCNIEDLRIQATKVMCHQSQQSPVIYLSERSVNAADYVVADWSSDLCSGQRGIDGLGTKTKAYALQPHAPNWKSTMPIPVVENNGEYVFQLNGPGFSGESVNRRWELLEFHSAKKTGTDGILLNTYLFILKAAWYLIALALVIALLAIPGRNNKALPQ